MVTEVPGARFKRRRRPCQAFDTKVSAQLESGATTGTMDLQEPPRMAVVMDLLGQVADGRMTNECGTPWRSDRLDAVRQ